MISLPMLQQGIIAVVIIGAAQLLGNLWIPLPVHISDMYSSPQTSGRGNKFTTSLCRQSAKQGVSGQTFMHPILCDDLAQASFNLSCTGSVSSFCALPVFAVLQVAAHGFIMHHPVRNEHRRAVFDPTDPICHGATCHP